MAKSEQKVKNLVAKIRNGNLMLPKIQHWYVWKSTDVGNLFDSLYKRYPSGLILARETDEPIKTHDVALAATAAPTRPLLLFDGRPRFTSLPAMMNGEGIEV